MHIVVTGSGQGIGKELAIALSSEEIVKEITLISKSDNVQETKNLILGKKELKVNSLEADVSNKEDIGKLDTFFKKTPPYALVNAAGILGQSGKFYEFDDSDILDVFSINVIGALNMINVCLPYFKSLGSGRIINFGGGGAAYAYPNFLPYALSKVSVIRMTENIAAELSLENFEDILINSIAPGAVKTQMLDNVINKGGFVKTTVDISEPVELIKFLIFNKNKEINGRFIHARDEYHDSELFLDSENLMLRRIENWKK